MQRSAPCRPLQRIHSCNMYTLKVFLFACLLGLSGRVAWAAQSEEQVCSADGTCEAVSDCEDMNPDCDLWAKSGECTKNPAYMLQNCQKSCDVCDKISTSSTNPAEQGSGIGELQKLVSPAYPVTEEQTKQRIVESRKHIRESTLPRDLLQSCQNENAMCTIWALTGECEANPKYMKKSCAPACLSCEYLSVEHRCPLDPNAKNAWEPGDLDAMFERLTAEPYLSKYSVEILSSPATDGPWVLMFDDFLSEQEANTLIELGAIEGYDRSTDVGGKNVDGTFEKKVSKGRTSTNAWCQNDCYKNETAVAVIERLSEVTGIDETNSEYLQMLRYEVGQRYNAHHDLIEHQVNRQQGVRILTLYMYLNDVEEGGGTKFNRLDLTVQPKRGRAVLWPSVFNDDPNKKDSRTIHEALPVLQGVKYGANAWFHLRDFKTPNREGCQ
eukprot:Nitzschia sp. Nitz4//scaffold47_size129522//15865//17730//NITZ4_003537-RA/size129522-snap-gene-0.192-mRNA-1//-1//CDS//3329552758//8525//frame0